MHNPLAYLFTTLVFIALDAIWLGLIAKAFYRDQLRFLMADRFHFGAAGLFYLLYPLGLALFAVWPALETRSLTHAWTKGAAFGFFAYMTYDLTNLATLKDWPLRLTLVDIAWGTLLSAIAAAGGYYLSRLLL